MANQEINNRIDRGEQRAAWMVAALSSFLTPFMGSSVNIALPAIGAEFGLNEFGLGWVASIYLVTAAAFLMPVGRWADLRGRRNVFCAGMAIYTAASVLLVMAPGGATLIALRGVQGFGGSMMFATGMAVLMSATAPEKRGKAIGLNVACVYLGLSAGPMAGGFLTHHYGWRSLFLFNGTVGAVALVMAMWKLHRDSRVPAPGAFDYAGSLFYVFSMGGFIYGISHLRNSIGIVAAACGVGLFLLFLYRQSRVSNPIVDLRLFRQNRVFAMSNLAALINYSATAAVTFLLSIYLQNVLGMTAENAGFVMVAQPAMMALFSPLAGSLSDRVEPRRVASMGMALTAVGLALFAIRGDVMSGGFIVGNLVFMGMGFALFSSPNTNAIISSVDKSLYGVASATTGTMRLTGQMLSMGIVLSIFGLKMGGARAAGAYHAALVPSMRIAFAVSFALCCCGIFASLARGRLRQ